jgi:hypothetical protein
MEPQKQQTLNDAFAKVRKQRKLHAAKFCKRRATFLKKADQLQQDCDVDIYVAVRNRRNNQVWQYSNGYLPPTSDEMV